jgi:gliding motility-associated-like protein
MNICDGTSVTLTANNPDGASITWDNGVIDGVSFTPAVGTVMYTVTATDGTTNCVSTDSIEVTVNPEPQIDLTSAVITDENCTDGGQVTGITVINGTPTYTYQWLDGTTNIDNAADVTGLTAGSYTLIVTDAQGCDDTTNVTINFVNDAVVIAMDDTTSTIGVNAVTIYVNANDVGDETSITIISQPNNGIVTDQGNGELTYTPEGGYTGVDSLDYVICDPNCTNTCDTASVYITVKQLDSLIIPNGFTPNNDNFNDYFVIKNLEQYTNNSIIIFNRWGDEVYTAAPYKNDWDGTSGNPNVISSGNQVVEGTYFFVLDLGVEGKEKISGFIDLRRK